MSAIVLDKDHTDALDALSRDPFADISQWLSDRLWLAGLVTWDGPERRATLTSEGRAILAHRCRSCLWFSEPLWPEHRPACLWRPMDAKEPPWVRGRHYVSAEDAQSCKVWEAGERELPSLASQDHPQEK